jgi:hypothetical protein
LVAAELLLAGDGRLLLLLLLLFAAAAACRGTSQGAAEGGGLAVRWACTRWMTAETQAASVSAKLGVWGGFANALHQQASTLTHHNVGVVMHFARI